MIQMIWGLTILFFAFSRTVYASLSSYIIDHGNEIDSTMMIGKVVLVLIILFVVLTMGQGVHDYCGIYLIQKKIKKQHQILIKEHLYIKENKDLITDSINKIPILEKNYYQAKYALFDQMALLLVSLVTLSFYSWLLAGLFVLETLILIFISSRASNQLKDLLNERQDLFSKYSETIKDAMLGQMIIKMYQQFTYILDKLDLSISLLNDNAIKRVKIEEIMMNLSMFLMIVVSIGYSIYGIYLIEINQMTLGQLVAIGTLSSGIIKPIQKGIHLYAKMQSSKNALKSEVTITSPKIQKDLVFEAIEINHAYLSVENQLLQEDIHLKINKGDKVLITGENGSGKSIFIKALLGFYPFKKVTMYFNENEVSCLPIDLFAYVSQHIFLFPGKVKDCFSNFFYNLQELDELLNLLNLESSFLNKEIGMRGENLSSDQKQKVALIRAILSKRPILALDEAFSTLDKESKNTLLSYLLNKKEMTLILIEHYDIETYRSSFTKHLHLIKREAF